MISSSPAFGKALAWGQVGETVIAKWLRRKGYTILPVYDVPLDTGKGPRLYTAYKSGHDALIAPDMLTMKGTRIQWVEAKRKTCFTWRKYPPNASKWQTGIDLRHYEHYLHVREHTGFPLWVMFLHMDSTPSDLDQANGCDPACPTGLFGGEILYLEKHFAHKDGFQRDGRRYPMVYWNHEILKPLATLSEVST